MKDYQIPGNGTNLFNQKSESLVKAKRKIRVTDNQETKNKILLRIMVEGK